MTGPPGAGKTTVAIPLAAGLGVPLISKDAIKEALLSSLGAADVAASARLGRASYEVMFSLAQAAEVMVLESNFGPESCDRILAISRSPIQIYCRCEPDEAIRRYSERTSKRHPGHFDEEMLEDISERIRAEEFAPLALPGPTLELDTTDLCDIDAVIAWVEALPEWKT